MQRRDPDMERHQADRVSELLSTSIQVSGLSEKELEERLGWKPGSVSRLLEGGAGTEPERVLEVLSELSLEASWSDRLDPGGPVGGTTQLVADLLERFQRLPCDAEGADPVPESELKLAELEKRVESVLREAFGPGFDDEPAGES